MSSDFNYDGFEPSDIEIVEAEYQLHMRVREAVRRQALEKAPDMSAIKDRLIEIRDEAIHASERDLPALFQALYTHHSLASHDFAKKLPDMRSPYFGHMRLEEDGKIKEILIGYRTFIDTEDNITIVDWRHAAISKIFFNYKEGEDYEVELPGRFAEGRLLMRRLIAFDVGELTGVSGPGYQYSRVRGGTWFKQSGGASRFSAGAADSGPKFGTGQTGRGKVDISALLDQEQYDLLTRDEREPLLVLGGAGCGKTTVATHRMAHLHYADPGFFAQNAMMIVVPEQGLVRLSERLLKQLQMEKTDVNTYDTWVRRQFQRMIKGVPKRICDQTPGQVVFAKRHPVMMEVIKVYAGVLRERCAQQFASRVGFDLNKVQDKLGANANIPLITALKSVVKQVKENAETETAKLAVDRWFEHCKTDILNFEASRSEIFTLEELQEVMLTRSSGGVTKSHLSALASHVRNQFQDPDGGRTAGRGVKEVDGADFAEDEVYRTVDVEDFTILLLLAQELNGRLEWNGKGLTAYAHMVIDEAQDLSTLETSVLGAALKSSGSVTIAGDVVQQSDPTVTFLGWDAIFSSLNQGKVAPVHLSTNYRCPKPIADLGYEILGDQKPAEPPKSLRDGAPIMKDRYPNEGLGFVAIMEALEELSRNEPSASVAIVARDFESATHVYNGLKEVHGIRFVPDGDFSFQPGVDVTDLDQVKGLEFDYVIIPDCNAEQYPDTPVARRALHIAVTRAVHQLWVMAIRTPSPVVF